MLRFGNITEVQPDACYARVKFLDDGIVSAPLQILVRAALVDKDSFTFEINEQVAVLMDENSEEGVILGAIFNDNTKPTGGGKGIFIMKFGDDSEIKYDRTAHKYTIDVKGDVEIKAEGDVIVEADIVDVTAATVKVDATQVEVDADAVTVDALMIDLTGTVNLTGDLIVSGSISAPSFSGAGGVTMSGGNIEAPGEVKGAIVKAGTVDLGTHLHAGVTPGSGNTAPPTP